MDSDWKYVVEQCKYVYPYRLINYEIRYFCLKLCIHINRLDYSIQFYKYWRVL